MNEIAEFKCGEKILNQAKRAQRGAAALSGQRNRAKGSVLTDFCQRNGGILRFAINSSTQVEVSSTY